MNIFATHSDPFLSSRDLDDKRMIKMILESTQLLCGALRYYGCAHEALYMPTHMNHPCAIWTRACVGNFYWLMEYTQHLCDNYFAYYHKHHACEDIIDIINIESLDYCIPNGIRTPFANCTPYKEEDRRDVHQKYRDYLKAKWQSDVRKPTWKLHGKPNWFN